MKKLVIFGIVVLSGLSLYTGYVYNHAGDDKYEMKDKSSRIIFAKDVTRNC